MFLELLNNVQMTYINGKYELENISKFIKNDFEDLCRNNADNLIQIMMQAGMINAADKCEDCGVILNTIYRTSGRHPYFRCKNKDCSRRKVSIFKNSIFSGMNISMVEVLNLLYSFSCRRTISDASETLDHSKQTVMAFYKLFRASILYFLDKNSNKIGGEGIVIHFDETPITSRHGNTGRYMPSNTVWVVGAINIYTRGSFLKFLPSRSRNDLFHFLNEWILPGSVVHTDCLASYNTLSSLGFTHFSVNHSRNLISPDGIHAN